MGWKEAQRRYKKHETLADQSTEDRVARRVLRGLGLKAKQLPAVERSLLGDADFDEALWPRVLAVWKRLDPVFHRARMIEVIKLDSRRGINEVLERMDEVEADDGVKPVFMTIADTVKAGSGWAYIPVHKYSDMGSVKPPFKALAEFNGMYLVLQDIEQYVASHGPYNLEVEDG